MRYFEEAVEKVLPNGTGRFRYVLIAQGLVFHSVPLNKEQVIAKWDDMTSHSNLSAVQYESKADQIWLTF